MNRARARNRAGSRSPRFTVDVFPQEITRVLLNLISNGFYAATKRKGEVCDGGYEPTLARPVRTATAASQPLLP